MSLVKRLIGTEQRDILLSGKMKTHIVLAGDDYTVTGQWQVIRTRRRLRLSSSVLMVLITLSPALPVETTYDAVKKMLTVNVSESGEFILPLPLWGWRKRLDQLIHKHSIVSFCLAQFLHRADQMRVPVGHEPILPGDPDAWPSILHTLMRKGNYDEDTFD